MSFPAPSGTVPVNQPPFQDSTGLHVGSAAEVLLLVESAALRKAMAEVVEAMPHARLAGAFERTEQVMDWATWDGGSCHLAFVDFAMRAGSPSQVVTFLLSQDRPGTVVLLGDARWAQMQQACEVLGAARVIDRGDVAAFRDFLAGWLHAEADAGEFACAARATTASVTPPMGRAT